jgi:hypothetical protein
MEVINNAWNTPTTDVEPCHVLFHKLHHIGRALSTWSRWLFSNTKVMVHASLLVILHFDLAQESRRLSANERDRRARLKRKVIALAVVKRARKKQSARIRCRAGPLGLALGKEILNFFLFYSFGASEAR